MFLEELEAGRMPAVDRKELRKLVNDAREEARTTVFDDEGELVVGDR